MNMENLRVVVQGATGRPLTYKVVGGLGSSKINICAVSLQKRFLNISRRILLVLP